MQEQQRSTPGALASRLALAMAGALCLLNSSATAQQRMSAPRNGARLSAPPPAGLRTPGQGSRPGRPTDLKVEFRENPLGVDDALPRFTWFVQDQDRGEIQTSYRILVSSSQQHCQNLKGDLWDSGKVGSTDSTNVEYAGLALTDNTRYWWRVRTWDRSGAGGPWSDLGTFDIAVLYGGWTASYIWDGTFNANNHCYLRKSFQLAKPVAEARVHVTAHDDFRLFVNGLFLGAGPAQADPYGTALYRTFDITSLLVQGENVVAAQAFFHGANSGCGVLGTPAFFLEGKVEYTDGTSIPLVSDTSWKRRATTPFNESSPFRGPNFAYATTVEDYDSRVELDTWFEVGFDDSLWPNASSVSPGYALRAQTVPPQTTTTLIDPVSIETPAAGVYLVDFGKNLSGFPTMAITGASAGDVVSVWYSEQKVGNRIIRDRDRIDDYHDLYTCSADAIQFWEPSIKYNGFRYLEIEGYPGVLTANKIKMRWAHTELKQTGGFACSNPLFNQIYDISLRTQINCSQGVLVDCPQREQTQYLADSAIQGLNIAYNFDNPDLMRKCAYDFYTFSPTAGPMPEKHPSMTGKYIPEWVLHWPVILWNQYLFYDDQRTLAELYPKLKAVMDYMGQWQDGGTGLLTGIPAQSIGDYPVDYIDQSESPFTIQNSLYYNALRITADIADLLGIPADAATYDGLADSVANGLNSVLFDGVEKYQDCKNSSDYHAMASIMPLHFGIVPADKEQAVLAYVKSLGFEPHTLGGFYLAETLYQFDQGQHMYDLLNQATGQWGLMLANDATTTWEGWDPSPLLPPYEGSLAHAWSAYPMKFFLSGIMGVEPLTPAYETFRIRPRVDGGLSWAAGAVPTPRGSVMVRWDKVNGGLALSATVPVNTTAEIHLPLQSLPNPVITEGGVEIWNSGVPTGSVPGVSFSEIDGDFIVFQVGSGDYLFAVTP